MQGGAHLRDVAVDGAICHGGWFPVQGLRCVLVVRVPHLQRIRRVDVHRVQVRHSLHAQTTEDLCSCHPTGILHLLCSTFEIVHTTLG